MMYCMSLLYMGKELFSILWPNSNSILYPFTYPYHLSFETECRGVHSKKMVLYSPKRVYLACNHSATTFGAV